MRSHPSLSGAAEREQLVRAAAAALRSDGWSEVRATGCAGFRTPQALVVPLLHVPLQPDLCASHPRRRGPLLGVVVTGRDLGDASLGLRWQALAAWAREHGGVFTVFVSPQDEAPARALAGRWHLDPSLLRVVRIAPPSSHPERVASSGVG